MQEFPSFLPSNIASVLYSRDVIFSLDEYYSEDNGG